MFNIDKQQVLDAFRHRRATRAYDPSKKISPDDFAYIPSVRSRGSFWWCRTPS